MKLGELIKDGLIFDNLSSSSKEEALDELATLIASQLDGVSQSDISSVLKVRERLGSTGTEDGIAIPHGKLSKLETTVVALARSTKGIDFDSRDKKPAKIFAVLLAPEHEVTTHLKLLARLSRLLSSKTLRDNIISAKNASEICRVLKSEDERIE